MLCGSHLGKTSVRRPLRQDTRTTEGALPLRNSSGISQQEGIKIKKGLYYITKMTKQKQKLGKRLRLK